MKVQNLPKKSKNHREIMVCKLEVLFVKFHLCFLTYKENQIHILKCMVFKTNVAVYHVMELLYINMSISFCKVVIYLNCMPITLNIALCWTAIRTRAVEYFHWQLLFNLT